MESYNINGRNVLIIAIITALLVLLLSDSAGAVPYAYITNHGSNNISVIDTATNAVTATVIVGRGPVGVAVNPVGTRVYVRLCQNPLQSPSEP